MRWIPLAAVLALLACNGKSAPTQPPAPSGPDDADVPSAADRAACDQHADKVAELYRAHLTDPVDGEVADATSLILSDCYREADRLAACVGAATTVAELESQCVIPLDDEGLAEHRRFGKRTR